MQHHIKKQFLLSTSACKTAKVQSGMSDSLSKFFTQVAKLMAMEKSCKTSICLGTSVRWLSPRSKCGGAFVAWVAIEEGTS